MCYDCDELPHQRDCGRVADCGPNMVSVQLIKIHYIADWDDG